MQNGLNDDSNISTKQLVNDELASLKQNEQELVEEQSRLNEKLESGSVLSVDEEVLTIIFSLHCVCSTHAVMHSGNS